MPYVVYQSSVKEHRVTPRNMHSVGILYSHVKINKRVNMDSSLLSLFWTLAEGTDKERISVSLRLSRGLKDKQDKKDQPGEEMTYVMKRLVKGLASSRRFARLGYATALSRILRDYDYVSIPDILKLIGEDLKVEKSLSKSDRSNAAVGQILAYLCLIRTGKIDKCKPSELKQVLEAILDIYEKKVPLRHLCTQALVQITQQAKSTQFTQVIWPKLSTMLSCGWEKCTPDHLCLLIAVRKHHKDVVDKSFLLKHWQSNKLLVEENMSKMAALIVKSTADHPMVHPISAELLQFASRQVSLKIVWQQMFNGTLLDVKKDAVGLVYLKMLPTALALAGTPDVMKAILADKTICCLLRHLSHTKSVLHKPTKEVTTELAQLIALLDKELQVAMVMCFLRSSVGTVFDNVTHTSTVGNLIRSVKADAAEEFARFFMDVATGKQALGKKDGSSDDACRFAIGQLSHMVIHPAMATSSDWQLRILRFLCLHGHFTLTKTSKTIEHCKEKPETDFSPNLRKFIQDSFKHALSKLSTFQPEKGNKTVYLHLLRSVVKYFEELLTSPKCVTPVKAFPASSREEWGKVMAVTKRIEAESQSSKGLTENLAFEMAFLQMALELFTDPDGASEVLQDLFVCHERAMETKKKVKKKNKDEPDWIEVLIELLLSLLSRPSQLMRSVVNTMFGVICPSLTPSALQLITQSLQSSGSDDGPLDFEDDDDDEDDMEIENGGDESSESEESEESGFSSAESAHDDESEADDVSDVDERMRANVKAALGHAAVESDAEGSEADLSDSEMEKLDEVLGAAFRSMKKGKKEVKEKAVQIKNYKMRCLELLEILIQSEAMDVSYLLSVVEPLILLMDEAQKDKEQKDLQERTHRVFKNLLKAKYVCPSDPTKLLEKIEHFIKLSTKVTGIPMVTDVAQTITLMAKIVLSKSGKDSTAQKTSSEKPHTESLRKLGGIFKEAVLNFCKKRDTLIHYMLFHTVFTNLPALLWPLLDDLFRAALNPELRVFRRTQLCGMISTAIQKNSVVEMGEKEWKSTASLILNNFTKMLNEAAGEKDMKKKFVQEILSGIRKVVHVSDHQLIKELLDTSLLEQVKHIHAKAKDHKDLKRVCNQLKNILSQLNPGAKEKPKNRKRKAENPPPDDTSDEKSGKTKKIKQKTDHKEDTPSDKSTQDAQNADNSTVGGDNSNKNNAKMEAEDNIGNDKVNGESTKKKKKKTKKHKKSGHTERL